MKHWLELVSTLRLTRKRFAHLLLGVGVTLNAGLTYTPVSADVVATDKSALQDKPAATLVELPHTDGDGLLPKPPAFTKEESAQLLAASRHACEGPCVTPFGTVLGAADGAESRSNCVSTCVRPEYSFLDLRSGEVSVYPQNPNQPNLQYIGITYQCVEYVRKWWMKNKGITFGSIDSAHEILYLTEGTNIRTQEPIPLARSLNGTAHRPPKRGDLVIYYPDRSDPEWRHGHAAVVVAVDHKTGTVSLAEENYENQPWQNPEAFARQIQLFDIAGRYTLLDVSPTAHKNPEGGRIAGWIYPLSEK